MAALSGRYGVVSTGTTFPDLTIDWADRSIYNHAFLLTDDGGGLVEATPHGVRRGHLSEYAGHPMMFNCGDDMTDDQRSAVVRLALGYVGLPYGWDDIVRLGLARLGVKLAWLDRHVARSPAVVCSELVAQVGEQAGLTGWLCGQKLAGAVTPGLLAARPGMKPYPSP